MTLDRLGSCALEVHRNHSTVLGLSGLSSFFRHATEIATKRFLLCISRHFAHFALRASQRPFFGIFPDCAPNFPHSLGQRLQYVSRGPFSRTRFRVSYCQTDSISPEAIRHISNRPLGVAQFPGIPYVYNSVTDLHAVPDSTSAAEIVIVTVFPAYSPSPPVPALAACAPPRRHPEILTHCPRTRHVVDISRPQVAWLTRFISLAASVSPTPAASTVNALISLVSAVTLAASISPSLPATTITSTSALSPAAYVVPPKARRFTSHSAPLHQPRP